MKFGVTIFLGSTTISIVRLARAAEEAGFTSLFLPEHTHIPVSRQSAYEPEADRDIPTEFKDVVDPFVALAAAAVATERLELATGLCLIAQRDPIILAKEVSTLDLVSGGRVRLGVGPGWNREEMRNHSLDPSTRHGRMEESVDALRRIWTEDEAGFEGEHVSFDPIWQWPKPVQRPHPPILIGGSGPNVLARVVAHGDGWLASTKREEESELAARVAELQDRAAEAGRGRLPVVLQRAIPEDETLELYAQAGIDECTFGLPAADEQTVLDELERLAGVVKAHQ